MAKDLGLLDNGWRKIGNVVLQRNNVQRVRQTTIKNPRTQGQIIQRVIVATAAGMAAGLKGIVNHSFENIPYGGKSIAEFRKLALKALREQAKIDLAKSRQEQQGCFVPYGISACLPNETIISRGSLVYDTDYLPHWWQGNQLASADIAMNEGITADVTGWTVAEWWWYFMGMRPGRQLTWIFMGYDDTVPEDENIIYSAVPYADEDWLNLNRHIKRPLVKVMRLVMKDASSPNWNFVLQPDMIRETVVSALRQCIEQQKTDEYFLTRFFVEAPYWRPDGDTVEMETIPHLATDIPDWDGTVCAVAGIHSEKVGGKWLRTTSKLLRTSIQMYKETSPARSPRQGLNIDDAVASWLQAPRASESERYLNEGL